MKVAVIGLGRAGLPLAAVMADAGLEVVGVDIDPKKVHAVNSGKNHIPEEAGLDELVRRHGGRALKATTDIKDAKDAKAYIVIVPLLLDKKNKPDFTLIKAAFKDVASVLKDGDLVVLETTVPPKTTEKLVKGILDKSGREYLLAYSPERIMTGCSISRLKEFPKVVGGINRKSTDAAYELYSKFSRTIVTADDSKTAEMVKVAEGIYRDVNIALANELLKVCEEIGVDFWSMRQAATHQYCNIHEPGMVGGHCIPVYPWFLINQYNVPLIKTARRLNDKMVEYYADKALAIAKPNGKVAVIGLSYRSGVKEASHTRAHALIKALKKRRLQVFGMDSMFTEEDVKKLFKIKPLTDPKQMDAIILANNVKGLKTAKERVVDVKNTMR
ncbi:MAG: nucleotide sugar dehydrogenase [Candidatus Altiarchaeota archaeon]